MDESQVQAQLQQMQNFIMQEAEDKASEIRNKAQEEFSIQKSNIVVVEKQKIIKEYERKEKQIGVKKKMYVAWGGSAREIIWRAEHIGEKIKWPW